MIEILTRILTATWAMTLEMAPYLLLGFGVAGLLSVFVSAAWVERHLGRKGSAQVVKASLFGVPLPLCSCGVLPVAASLHRHGASRGATTAFLVSTPQTGVDSIAVTWALLGPLVAVVRPLAAFATGIAGGLLVSATDRDEAPADTPAADACADDCCEAAPPSSRLGRALHYGFVTLPRDIGRALIVGLVLSGVIATFISPGSLSDVLGGGVGAYLAAIVVGIPLYVCATASTPIAASLVAAGLSPGAALAFLITGPATNSAAITTLWRVLGRRAVGLYLLTVALGAVATGLVVDLVAGLVPLRLPEFAATGAHVHHHGEGHGLGWWLATASAVVLILVLVNALRPRPSAMNAEDPMSDEGDRVELAVEGMRCNGCVDSVTRALRECAGVSDVVVDLDQGRARIDGARLQEDELSAAVASLGFECQVVS
jgi:uncharacterized membrane protein YraQ (UPF0718 family)/copper chaperone CopZ